MNDNSQDKNFPTAFQRKVLWRALTGLSFLVLASLLVSLIWLTSITLNYLQPVLIPLAVAGIVAYLLDPVVAWFQKKGMSRLRAVLSVFGSFIVAALIFAAIIIPPLFSQVSNVIHERDEWGQKITLTLNKMKEVPVVKPAVDWALDRSEQHPPKAEEPNKVNPNANKPETDKPETDKPETDKPETDKPEIVKPEIIKPSFAETNLGVYLNENSSTITSIVKTLLAKSAGTLLGYFGLFIGFLMIPIYLYYFLKESAAIKENWQNYVPLKASKFKTEVVETLKEINGYTISFFRGQVLVAFIDGILVGVGLMLFGLPYGLVIGIVMAFLGVIPFIGNLLCMIPACLIAYIHFSDPAHHDMLGGILGSSPWAYVGAVLAIFVVVQQINSLVTAPKIVGDSVGLHPMTVIFSMLFWSLILGGFVGALLAVPLTAAVKVIFVRYVWERRIMEQPEESEDIEDSEDASDDEVEEPSQDSDVVIA